MADVKETLSEAIDMYRRGEAVESVKLPAKAPGYEDKCQELLWETVSTWVGEPPKGATGPESETLRQHVSAVLDVLEPDLGEFSHRQVEWVVQNAYKFLTEGYEATINKLPDDQRSKPVKPRR